MTCKHEFTRQIGRDRCYQGPVSRDENRAAHGGITYTQECRACGVRRDISVNGNHAEFGEWGPSRAAREDVLRSARRRLASTPLPPGLTRGEYTARVDPQDGLLEIATPPGIDHHGLATTLPADYLAQARAYRTAALAVLAAEEEL